MSITSVTSEALQRKIRELLPSQQGFSTDLSAQDTIVPIIDLTATAEGSGLPVSLQQAVAFGNASTFSVFNATTDIITTPGFFRITCVVNQQGTGTDQAADLNMTDGASSKVVWSSFITSAYTSSAVPNVNLDLIVFVNTGESVSWTCGNHSIARGSVRQVASLDGTLINPTGFNPQ